MWVFHFQMRPLLSLEDAQVPIPCQEVLWEADSAFDWQQLYDPSTRKCSHLCHNTCSQSLSKPITAFRNPACVHREAASVIHGRIQSNSLYTRSLQANMASGGLLQA